MPAHGASSSHPRRSPSTGSGPNRGADGLDHLTGEAESIGPVFVLAHVGQAREELADQAELTGIDLHAVNAGRSGEPGRLGETTDDDGDVGVLHLLGHLARRRIGEARRSEQGPLAIRTRPLAAAMPEGGQHQGARAGRLDPPDDGGPAVNALAGQRRPLVGPVALVDRHGLGDHDPAAPLGPACVVRHGAIAKGTPASTGSSRAVRTRADWARPPARG